MKEEKKSKIKDPKQKELDSNRRPSKKFKITTLPPDFYSKVIELENKIQLSQFNMDDIKELGALYKKAIEVFCTSSPKNVRFFSNKLTKLLMGVDKLAKKQNKKASKWSQYMNSHKKNYNKFMLFLELESSNQEAEQILENDNKKFSNLFVNYYNNIDEQKKNFRDKLKNKKNYKNEINEDINEVKEINIINEEKENISDNINNEISSFNVLNKRFKGRNDLVDSSLKDFFKKYHYIYLNSTIFKEPIESFNYILDDMFCHKVAKYFYYQEQIKEFEMILGDKDKSNHEDSLAFFLTDLQNERKKYYLNLEIFIDKIKKNIQNRCSEAHISKDQNLQKYKDEFMKDISKIFY